MGNKAPKLKKKDLDQYKQSFHFSENEIQSFWAFFHSLNPSNVDGGSIGKMDFLTAMNFRPSVLVDRIFSVLDVNHDGRWTFVNFLSYIYKMSDKSSNDDKLLICFQLFDVDGDGLIGTSDLQRIVGPILEDQGLGIPEREMAHLCEGTVRDIGQLHPGFISMGEYSQLAARHERLLTSLTVSVASFIQLK